MRADGCETEQKKACVSCTKFRGILINYAELKSQEICGTLPVEVCREEAGNGNRLPWVENNGTGKSSYNL